MDKLLEILTHNARLNDEALGAMLGVSAEEIAAKIAKYEEDGIIRGYKTVIDWEKVDADLIMAFIELKVTPQSSLGFDQIAQEIMSFDEVESVYLMSGGYDISVIVTGHSFKNVALFVQNRLAVLEPVVSTATHFVLTRYKDNGMVICDAQKDERGTHWL